MVRLLGAAGITALLASLMRDPTFQRGAGNLAFFTSAHAWLTLAIWSVAPALTSDAIAQERRAGTLPLLFATPLTARSIVLAKSCVHMSRVLSLWLATVPPLLAPILFGGVTSLDMASSVVIELSVALVALGAGVAASAWIKHPLGALLVAEVLAALAVGFSAVLFYTAYLVQVAPALATPTGAIPTPTEDSAISLLMGSLGGGGWSGVLARTAWRAKALWAATLAEFLMLSLAGCGVLVSIAIFGTRLVWRDNPMSLAQERRRRVWLSPRYWIQSFAREKRQLLDGNPLHWAQQHSTWARLSILAWCGLIMLVNSVILPSARPWEPFEQAQFWLTIGLVVHMTFASVTFLRGPRESGALELMLVSSMGVGPLIRFALAGFWRRFAPPLILLLLLSQVFVWHDIIELLDFSTVSFLISNLFTTSKTGLAALGFLTIPATGMYASLRFRSFTAPFLFTGGFAIALPLFCGTFGQFVQVGIALSSVYALQRTLAERTFASQEQPPSN